MSVDISLLTLYEFERIKKTWTKCFSRAKVEMFGTQFSADRFCAVKMTNVWGEYTHQRNQGTTAHLWVCLHVYMYATHKNSYI